MGYCPKCGSQLPEGAPFCYNCGALEDTADQCPYTQRSTAKPIPTVSEVKQVKSKKGFWKRFFPLFVSMLIVYGLASCIENHLKSKNPPIITTPSPLQQATFFRYNEDGDAVKLTYLYRDDIVSQFSQEKIIELDEITQDILNDVNNFGLEQEELYKEYSFISYDIFVEGNTIRETFCLNNLDNISNLSTAHSLGFFEGYEEELGLISFKLSEEDLIANGWLQQ